MDTGGDEARDSRDQKVAHPRMLSKWLNQKGILFEKLCPHKNERLGNRFTVSARRNEIGALLSSEEKVQLAKEKLPGFLAAADTLKEANLAYSRRVLGWN